MPAAKTQEEYKAYQEATAKPTPAEVEAAAAAFATQYPQSDLKLLVYRKAMYDYQNINNGEKTVAMARKMLALDANSPEALVTFATVTAQSTRETDLDREERLNEAADDASKALQTINTDLLIPADAPKDRVEAFKNSLRAMAYDALGTVAMVKKDYPTAETNLSKSAELNVMPDPVTYLRLSVGGARSAEKVSAGARCRQQGRAVFGRFAAGQQPGEAGAGPAAETDERGRHCDPEFADAGNAPSFQTAAIGGFRFPVVGLRFSVLRDGDSWTYRQPKTENRQPITE
ncbi:MAG: hypothetical protein ACHP7I_04275 [Terriglobales bacterium]